MLRFRLKTIKDDSRPNNDSVLMHIMEWAEQLYADIWCIIASLNLICLHDAVQTKLSLTHHWQLFSEWCTVLSQCAHTADVLEYFVSQWCQVSPSRDLTDSDLTDIYKHHYSQRINKKGEKNKIHFFSITIGYHLCLACHHSGMYVWWVWWRVICMGYWCVFVFCVGGGGAGGGKPCSSKTSCP